MHGGHEGQARKGYWNGGRPYGYMLRKIVDPDSKPDAYRNLEQIGSELPLSELRDT